MAPQRKDLKDHTGGLLCPISCILHGYWSIIHRMALRATTRTERLFFIVTFMDIVVNLPCQECKHHALMYIAQNPIDPDNESQFYLFTWTWKFHNAVSERIGKEMFDWQSAYLIYVDNSEEECTDCTLGGIEPEPVPAKAHPRPAIKLRKKKKWV